MKRSKQRIISLFLTLCILLGLTACSTDMIEYITTLVDGNIKEIYLGEIDKDYLEIVDGTEEESRQAYLDGLEIEAEYFANYWGIVEAEYGETYEALSEDLKKEIVKLYREIYSHTKYEITSVSEQSDGTYAVKVLIDPINVMEPAIELYENDGYEPLNAFWTKYAELDFNTITDEEYMDYVNEYGEIIVRLVRKQLDSLTYAEQKSQIIQVEQVDDLWTINADDWAIFDSYVIYYP